MNAKKMDLIPDTVNFHKTKLFPRAGRKVAGFLKGMES